MFNILQKQYKCKCYFDYNPYSQLAILQATLTAAVLVSCILYINVCVYMQSEHNP